MAKTQRGSQNRARIKKPQFVGWLTTDEEEIARRRWRGASEIESFEILNDAHAPFTNYKVPSASGGSYQVEIRDLAGLENSCGCVDFRISRLGTCKHVEGVLHQLRERGTIRGKATRSPRIEIYPSNESRHQLKIVIPDRELPDGLLEMVMTRYDALIQGYARDDIEALEKLAEEYPDVIRMSSLCEPWRQENEIRHRREKKRQAFDAGEKTGQHSLDVLNFPLYPYQRDGVRHLALGERRLLADEMGLGKTVQALGASKLLQDLEGVKRALVVCPASLKTEWAEQITAATDLSYEIVSGPRHRRLELYRGPQFFTLTNYEQVLADLDAMQEFVNPDIVILDEAQRIKNWRTKTANAIKRLESRFAFVLTGTPLENRIDELYSIMQFLDPEVLGSLFRFNREYYQLDANGRAIGYRNLDKLRESTRNVILRRRKADVEGDLPNRTDRNHYLPMTDEQRERYVDYERAVAAIAQRAKRRPLTPEEFQRLQIGLACMRMMCDTPYILDQNVRDCPKLDELERVIEDMLEEPDGKIIIFSEWVRMLELVRNRIEDLGIGYAWHTGSVAQDRRRIEINRFKDDPECRIFLSSESGGVGLNLQVANNVINMDLPWNPAKLEQRIARAWRKHQKRSVTVVNLVTTDSIEERMLHLLKQKQAIADNVLDGHSGQTEMELPSGRKAFMERLESIMAIEPTPPREKPPARESLIDRLAAVFGDNLFATELRQTSAGGDVLLAVVKSDLSVDDADIVVEPHEPQLEIIGKDAYEAMMRLASVGLIQFPQPGQHDLLATAARPEDRLEQARQRRKMALEHLEQAKRKRQMAALLSGGGFDVEAESAAPAITDLSLRALAADSGHPTHDGEWNEEGIWTMCETMRSDGVLTQEQQFKLTWICQADEGLRSAPEQDHRKLPAALEFLTSVEAILSRPLDSGPWKNQMSP